MNDPTRTGYDTSPEGQAKEVRSELPEPFGFLTPADIEHIASRTVQYRGRNYNIKATVFLDKGFSEGSATEPVFTADQVRAAIQADRERAGAGGEAKIRVVIDELRWYKPAADAYQGKYVHKGWADRLESALAASPAPAEPVAGDLHFTDPMDSAIPHWHREFAGELWQHKPITHRIWHLSRGSMGTENAGDDLALYQTLLRFRSLEADRHGAFLLEEQGASEPLILTKPVNAVWMATRIDNMRGVWSNHDVAVFIRDEFEMACASSAAGASEPVAWANPVILLPADENDPDMEWTAKVQGHKDEAFSLPLYAPTAVAPKVLPSEAREIDVHQELRQRLEQFVTFLCGAGEFDGGTFGEKHPEHRGGFWWRTPLRTLEKELFAALRPSQPIPSVEVNEGLRKDAERDDEFLIRLAKRLGMWSEPEAARYESGAIQNVPVSQQEADEFNAETLRTFRDAAIDASLSSAAGQGAVNGEAA